MPFNLGKEIPFNSGKEMPSNLGKEIPFNSSLTVRASSYNNNYKTIRGYYRFST